MAVLEQRVAVRDSREIQPVFDEYVRTEWKLLAERRIAAPAAGIADLAAGLGFAAQTIRIWLRSPRYQRYENWRIAQERERIEFAVAAPSSRFVSETVPERFQEFQAEMQERLLDIVETTTNEKLRADLCKDWLAYSGIIPVDKPQNAGQRTNLTTEMLLMFAQRAKEAGLDFTIAVRQVETAG